MKKILAVCMLILAGVIPSSGWELTKSLSLGYIEESNLTTELEDRWFVKDGAIEAALNLGLEKEVKPGQRWAFSLELKNRDQQSFSAYDRFSWRLRASFRRKQGMGILAPWWRCLIGIGTTSFQNESFHNRKVTDIQVEAGKRLNPRTIVSGTLGFDQSKGIQTEILDLQGIFGNIRGHYSLDSRWSINGSYQYRRGDIAIHGWENYGIGLPTVDMEEWGTWHGSEKAMYKVSKARSNTWSLGFSRSIGKDANWSFSVEQSKTVKNSWSYTNLTRKSQVNFAF